MAGWDVVGEDPINRRFKVECPFCGREEIVTEEMFAGVRPLGPKPVIGCRCGQSPHVPSLVGVDGRPNRNLTITRRRPPGG